ncbi:MAG TPA: SprB repeat-containing protein [Saprospiraceae bacterium]|nr:SprB repeat-containing protein [Saprospiraceae bacterium]
MSRFCVAFVLLFFFFDQKISACGFNFVGDCSTGISLKINGTQDSFVVADCPGGLKFDGFVLGSLQSLSIARAKAITWESCQNNVSGMALLYRVYQQGFPGGAWKTLALQEDYHTLVGPYTTRYRSANSNTSLTNGLTVGNTYVLEIYFRAEVDTIGDDFIPETTLLQNNNGQNYHLTFQYGGPSAPPFLVTTTKIVNVKCYGDSTGVAGVSVYGNQSGLFYQWSTGGNNYWILSEIPAGTYSVTVTGAGGYSASDTMVINQPMPLAAQFSVTGLGCSGAPGQATATLSGGTAPYFYYWSNGEQTATATFLNSGGYSVTVSDSKGCSAGYPVNIPAQPIVEINLTEVICSGESYEAGGMSFAAAGNYTIQVDGFPNCDTMIYLNLAVLNPAAALLDLPQNALVTCANPSINLCAGQLDNTTFQWSQNGIPDVNTSCVLATAGGVYSVTATSTTPQKTCLAEKIIVVDEHLLAPNASYLSKVTDMTNCSPPDSLHLLLWAVTNAEMPVFQWIFNGTVISVNDTCLFVIPNFVTNLPELPLLKVTDIYGCTASADGTGFSISVPALLNVETTTVNPNPGFNDGSIALDISGGTSPYTVHWNNGATTTELTDLAAGTYCATVSDEEGCSTVVCETLESSGVESPLHENALKIAPNPVFPGQQVEITLPEKFTGAEVRLEILDLQGQTLLRQAARFDEGILHLALPEYFHAGVWIFHMTDGNGKNAIGRITVF